MLDDAAQLLIAAYFSIRGLLALAATPALLFAGFCLPLRHAYALPQHADAIDLLYITSLYAYTSLLLRHMSLFSLLIFAIIFVRCFTCSPLRMPLIC